MSAKSYHVEYGVKGAYRINNRDFDTLGGAMAFARRWSKSNSLGNYWSEVSTGTVVLDRFNLEAPEETRSCGCPSDYHLADCPILTDRYADSTPYDSDIDSYYNHEGWGE